MSTVSRPLARAAAIATILSGVALAAGAQAAPFDTQTSGAPNSTVTFDSNGHVIGMTPDTSEQSGMALQQDMGSQQQPMMHGPMHHHMAPSPADQGMAPPPPVPPSAETQERRHSPGEMKEHVEERIKTLHAKLMITKDQEAQWNGVAQAMRDNEANISGLIQERHRNAGNMTAIDDMDSYQAIAQAHADGLKKVSAAFKPLYDAMSPQQKQNADKLFSGYEGAPASKKGPHHHHHVKNKAAAQ